MDHIWIIQGPRSHAKTFQNRAKPLEGSILMFWQVYEHVWTKIFKKGMVKNMFLFCFGNNMNAMFSFHTSTSL